jgi:hypothetical protein
MFIEKYEIYYNGKLIKTIGYGEKTWLEAGLLAGGTTMTIDGIEYNARDLKVKDVSYVEREEVKDGEDNAVRGS